MRNLKKHVEDTVKTYIYNAYKIMQHLKIDLSLTYFVFHKKFIIFINTSFNHIEEDQIQTYNKTDK